MNAMTGIACLAVALATTLSQTPLPARSQLADDPDAVIQRAIERSPAVKQAAAEVEVAKARLEAEKVKIAEHVLSLQQELETLERDAEYYQKKADEGLEVGELRQTLRQLDSLNTQLRLLTGETLSALGGEQPAMGKDSPQAENVFSVARPLLEDTISEDAWSALNNEMINIDFRGMTLGNVAELLSQKFLPDFNLTMDVEVGERLVSLNLQEINCFKALMAIADHTDTCFVFRPYGIFLTTRERAKHIEGPTISEGVPYMAPVSEPEPSAERKVASKRPTLAEAAPESIRDALESEAPIVFEDVELADVLEYLSDTYTVNFVHDGATGDTVVRYISLRNVRLRDALEALFKPLGLCGVVKGNWIYVCAVDKASTMPGPTIPEDVPYYLKDLGYIN